MILTAQLGGRESPPKEVKVKLLVVLVLILSLPGIVQAQTSAVTWAAFGAQTACLSLPFWFPPAILPCLGYAAVAWVAQAVGNVKNLAEDNDVQEAKYAVD